MPDETMEVARSEENGNAPAETPSEPASEEKVEEVKGEVVPEVALYELPDGRKVDAETLTKEWKENFLPDYTRKSQILAEQDKGKLPVEKPTNPLQDPNYIPKTYGEFAKVIKEETLAEIEAKEQAKVDARQALETEVAGQLAEVKAKDPNLSEDALFLHATKYGFRDLRIAYQNMKDMNVLVKNVQKETTKNIAKRNDPVSTAGQGATVGAKPNPSLFPNAVEFLRSLKT